MGKADSLYDGQCREGGDLAGDIAAVVTLQPLEVVGAPEGTHGPLKITNACEHERGKKSKRAWRSWKCWFGAGWVLSCLKGRTGDVRA